EYFMRATVSSGESRWAMRLIAASGSLLFLKMPMLIAMAHIRRPSGPAGGGSAPWLASAFSSANVMLGPFDVWAMFLAMKFSLLPDPVQVRVSGGWRPSL